MFKADVVIETEQDERKTLVFTDDGNRLRSTKPAVVEVSKQSKAD